MKWYSHQLMYSNKPVFRHNSAIRIPYNSLLCVSTDMEISKGKLIFLKVLAFVAFVELALVAGFGYTQISDFEKLFNNFGEPVPLLTDLYILTYKYWGILTLFPLFILFQTLTSDKGSKLSFLATTSVLITHMIFGIVIFIFTVFAMYAPIFELGNTQ